MMQKIKTPFSGIVNNTGKHKDWYRTDFVQIFCQQINPKDKLFSNEQFVKEYNKHFKKLELKERLKLIVQLLEQHLDMPYKKQLKVLAKLLSKPWPYQEGMFNYGFFLYPVSQFVETHGHQDIDLSLSFIENLTMEFTGEWAIRPLANLDEKTVLKQMKTWAKHDNFHVRRLASEGLRARLPWGFKIDWINSHPEKSLPIYNKLRNDKVLYVRRSVANSMGDMIKINEDLAYDTFQKWLQMKKTKENLWIIKHAIRTPVKKKIRRFVSLRKELDKLTADMS